MNSLAATSRVYLSHVFHPEELASRNLRSQWWGSLQRLIHLPFSKELPTNQFGAKYMPFSTAEMRQIALHNLQKRANEISP